MLLGESILHSSPHEHIRCFDMRVRAFVLSTISPSAIPVTCLCCMSLQDDPKQKSTGPIQFFNVCFSNIKVSVIIILPFLFYSSSYFKWPSLLLQNLRMPIIWEGIGLHFLSN